MNRTKQWMAGVMITAGVVLASCHQNPPKQENFDNNSSGMDQDHTRTDLDTSQNATDSTGNAGVHKEGGTSRNSL